jgi:uncharacterized iron-regulated protein
MHIKTFLAFIVFVVIAVLAVLIISVEDISSYSSVLRVNDGEEITFEKMIEELKQVDIVFIGENHDDKKHHQAQFDVIKGIDKKGIPVSIGLEMFKAEDQETLDLWSAGDLELSDFLTRYYDSWGLPWSLYRNIFVFSRDSEIPMVGLNVPKAITRKVSQSGFQSLTD